MKNFKTTIIIAYIFTIFLGTGWHFIYELSGQQFLVGLFSPISESVWEHQKLIFYPSLLCYFYLHRKYAQQFPSFTTSYTISLLISLLLMPAIFYLYTTGFALESIALDIVLYYIIILLLYTSLYLFIVKQPKRETNSTISYVILSLLIVAFTIITIWPPNFPIFISSV